jgi:hypothetical protein
LSIRIAQKVSGIEINEIKLNNTGSYLHEWPVARGRSFTVPDFEIESRNSELNLLMARLSELRKVHSHLEISYSEMKNSLSVSESNRKNAEEALEVLMGTLSWKITAPLRFVRGKFNTIIHRLNR